MARAVVLDREAEIDNTSFGGLFEEYMQLGAWLFTALRLEAKELGSLEMIE